MRISDRLDFLVRQKLAAAHTNLPFQIDHEVIITMARLPGAEEFVPAGFLILAAEDSDYWDEPFAVIRPLENFFADQEDINELVDEGLAEIKKACEEVIADADPPGDL